MSPAFQQLHHVVSFVQQGLRCRLASRAALQWPQERVDLSLFFVGSALLMISRQQNCHRSD